MKGAAHLDKGIDSHYGHVRLTLGVIHQIEIDKLLEFEIVRLHAIDDIGKQRTEQKESKNTLSGYAATAETLTRVHTHRMALSGCALA